LTKNSETYLNLAIKNSNFEIVKIGNYTLVEKLMKEGAIITQDDLKNALDVHIYNKIGI
jgi:hypothetical protein